MAVLQVFLFGCLRLVQPGESVPVQVSRSVQPLLAYLLLQQRRSHPRELLAGLFWGDHSQERARCCLNTALWRLRQALEPAGVPRGTYLLTASSGEVWLNPESELWLDVAVFERQVSYVLAKPIETLETADVQHLEQTLQLYSGELLEGIYDDWALHERERLRRLYLNGLAQLMYYYKHQRAYEQSLVFGQKILAQDPLREEIHREMMDLYLQSGRRTLAIKQYEQCSHALASELGISPMIETQALFNRLAAEGDPQGIGSNSNRAPSRGQQALKQLQLAMHRLGEAQQQLIQAIKLVEQFVEPENETPL